jgi:hypothetical protein
MAFLKDNLFQEGNSEEYFFLRTNPLANPANAEVLKVKSCGDCDIELVVELSETMGGTQVTFGAPTSGYDVNYIKTTITDTKGNFATGLGTSFVLDTTNFSKAEEWVVTIDIQLASEAAIECPCGKMFTFQYVADSGIEINTTTLGIPVLRTYEVGDTTPTTAIALGTFAAGTSEPFQFVLKNTGGQVLKISSIVENANVLTAVVPNGGDVLFPNQSVVLSGTVDTDLSAGAKTGSVEIFSNGGNVEVDLTWTIA